MTRQPPLQTRSKDMVWACTIALVDIAAALVVLATLGLGYVCWSEDIRVARLRQYARMWRHEQEP